MSSQLTTIICVIFGVISWYYFNKFQESEREYSRLHKNFETLHVENQKMKSRIKDLQSYKNDVSKTFKILDNELILINDHLKRRNDQGGQQTSNRFTLPIRSNSQTSIPVQATIRTSTIPLSNVPLSRISSFTNIPSGNNVSLLTPELLTSLFNMNTEDLTSTNNTPLNNVPPQNVADQGLPEQNIPPQNVADQGLPEQNIPQNLQAELSQNIIGNDNQAYRENGDQAYRGNGDQAYRENGDQAYRGNENEEYSGLQMNINNSYDLSEDSNKYDQFLLNN